MAKKSKPVEAVDAVEAAPVEAVEVGHTEVVAPEDYASRKAALASVLPPGTSLSTCTCSDGAGGQRVTLAVVSTLGVAMRPHPVVEVP